jgi:hypothetical protein
VPVGHRLRERTRGESGRVASLYPLTLGSTTVGAAVGTYAAGAVVPAAALAVLGSLVLATLVPGNGDDGGS